VLAGDPRVAGGAMTLPSAHKMERFIGLCSTFGLPIVHFVDQPGNATGRDAELSGTLLGALRVGQAVEEARIPRVIDPRETRALICDWVEDARVAIATDRSRSIARDEDT
jgi:acetyl-CoA carboxylase carboxyltransferase component